MVTQNHVQMVGVAIQFVLLAEHSHGTVGERLSLRKNTVKIALQTSLKSHRRLRLMLFVEPWK